jgi:hypothetical protein
MPGTVTTSYFNKESDGVRGVNLAWACDSGGDVSGVTFGFGWGKIDAVHFRLNVNSWTPDSGYDVNLFNADSIDILNGVGANLVDTAAAVWKYPILPDSGSIHLIGDTLELNVANAGNDRRGDIVILLS